MATFDRSLVSLPDRLPLPAGSLEEAAHLADQVAAQDTFLRYRERKAHDMRNEFAEAFLPVVIGAR
jgi:hypothetical protein